VNELEIQAMIHLDDCERENQLVKEHNVFASTCSNVRMLLQLDTSIKVIPTQ